MELSIVKELEPKTVVIDLGADQRSFFEGVKAGSKVLIVMSESEVPAPGGALIFRLGGQSTSVRVLTVGTLTVGTSPSMPDNPLSLFIVGFHRVWTHASGDNVEVRLWRIEEAIARLRLCSHDPGNEDERQNALLAFDGAVKNYRNQDLHAADPCILCGEAITVGGNLFHCDRCMKLQHGGR